MGVSDHCCRRFRRVFRVWSHVLPCLFVWPCYIDPAVFTFYIAAGASAGSRRGFPSCSPLCVWKACNQCEVCTGAPVCFRKCLTANRMFRLFFVRYLFGSHCYVFRLNLVSMSAHALVGGNALPVYGAAQDS